ncbi:MAG: hypothetical protein RIB86_12080 [Imperialibacter sp.]
MAGRIRALKGPGRSGITMRRVPALRTKADTPRRYFIYRTYGTRSATLLVLWRYRHVVPNGTCNVARPGHWQALKGPERSVISMRWLLALRTIATPWRGFLYTVPTALVLLHVSACWRYRHIVPNGTGGAGAAGDLQAL